MSLILATLALLGQAQVDPLRTTSDPRIRLVTYDPGTVVSLPVAPGYAALVELGADERVDSVVVGNSVAWQVTTSRRGDAVVVKPVGDAPATDMVIITGERRYVLQLRSAQGDADAPYVLRFIHPPPFTTMSSQMPFMGGPPGSYPGANTAPPATYRFRGDRNIYPLSMRDDGQRTYVTWTRDGELPAVFALREGRETLVNGRAVGPDYVVEGVFDRFVFRLGRDQATATRRRQPLSRQPRSQGSRP